MLLLIWLLLKKQNTNSYQYGLTVTELEQLNPHIIGGLNVGKR